MNDARKKIEEFKSNNRFPGMGIAQLDIELPDGYESMDYHSKNKTYEQALDTAIAKHLKVELTDESTWIEERNKSMADEWARSLPDK
nr:hypothetical protein [uncultured Draconibacterium sp.]